MDVPILIVIHRRSRPKDMSLDALISETSASATWMHRLQLGGSKILCILRNVAQVAADALTKTLFLSVYEASNKAYWRRHATGCEWQSLGGIIEYTPGLVAVPGEREVPIYLIAIRAASNTDLERVAISVKARKSGVIHQQEITLDKLCSTPVRKALSAIPLKPKSSLDAGRHKLGEIYIKLVEAVNCDGVDLVKGKKIAYIFRSTGSNSVLHNQVERWGEYWNIDQINVEKENIKTRCYRKLVQSARKLGRPLAMRRTVYRLVTNHFGLNLIFWSRNLWNAKSIRTSIAQAQVVDWPINS